MYVAQERRAYILRLLQERGSIRSATIARELGVTDETIRTDLVDMQAQGLLKRVHGGAQYIIPQAGCDAAARPDCQLVQQALGYIEPGMRLYLDDHTLALVLVSQLKDMRCTLITPSLRLLTQLSAESLPHQVICPGGMLDKESGLLDSPAALDMLQQDFKPDICFLFPPALRCDVAAYRSPICAAWARAAAEAAGRTIVIAPSAALTAHAPYAIPLPGSHTLITENNLPANFNHPDMVLIPYISAEELMQQDSFDY